jgi:hypothetical protein|tara:strand:+ start:358 stop:675 length:318 start_codon:yes stop_codon:yes gene_type:complete
MIKNIVLEIRSIINDYQDVMSKDIEQSLKNLVDLVEKNNEITKDMFTQDSYRGNYYANKNAVMFDLQNGKQNVVCFCDNKFTAEAIVEGLNLIDNLEGDGAELRK